jgi:hypothetical protein
MLCCLVWFGLVWLVAPGVWAQPAETSPQAGLPNAERAPEATAIASDKVLQFASAYQQVLKIIDRREVEIQSAETDYIAARILRDVEGEALGVIEGAGLSRQEYVQMLNLANLDSEFGEEVALQLQELDAAPNLAQPPAAKPPEPKPLAPPSNPLAPKTISPKIN